MSRRPDHPVAGFDDVDELARHLAMHHGIDAPYGPAGVRLGLIHEFLHDPRAFGDTAWWRGCVVGALAGSFVGTLIGAAVDRLA